MTEMVELEAMLDKLSLVEEDVCAYAPEGHECHHGDLFNLAERVIVGECGCREAARAENLKWWRDGQIEKLKKILMPRIDLTATEKREWHKDLPESGGVWISGKAGNGKTHAAGWIVARHIKKSGQDFKWSWFKARQIFEAWVNQYSDDYQTKRNALDLMHCLKSHPVIVIDDFDKMGKITQAREEHLFDLIDSIHSRGAALIIPANITIDSFCQRMENESGFIKRDGIGPVQRRLKDICKEVRT